MVTVTIRTGESMLVCVRAERSVLIFALLEATCLPSGVKSSMHSAVNNLHVWQVKKRNTVEIDVLPLTFDNKQRHLYSVVWWRKITCFKKRYILIISIKISLIGLIFFYNDCCGIFLVNLPNAFIYSSSQFSSLFSAPYGIPSRSNCCLTYVKTLTIG